MEIKEYFRVADHNFSIQYKNAKDISMLLPSFEPFRLKEAPAMQSLVLIVELLNQPDVDFKGEIVHEYEWDNTHCVFYRDAQEYVVTINVVDSSEKYFIRMNSDFSRASVCFGFDWEMNLYMIKTIMMMLFAFATARYDTLAIHSSVIRKDGFGYLFLGVSGTGKSTHSQLWLDHISDTELMNDDNPILRVEDGVVKVFGSPWSGKTPCYKNIVAPVGAFVKLKQAPYNKISREPMIQQYGELMASVSSMRWDKRIEEPVCDTLAKILSRVTLFHLECLPDEAAAQLSYKTVSEDVKARNL